MIRPKDTFSLGWSAATSPYARADNSYGSGQAAGERAHSRRISLDSSSNVGVVGGSGAHRVTYGNNVHINGGAHDHRDTNYSSGGSETPRGTSSRGATPHVTPSRVDAASYRETPPSTPRDASRRYSSGYPTATNASPRIDPAAMPVAGGRVSNTRGVAPAPVASASAAYRESAQHAISGGGPPRAQNTPKRGTGGNSSMSGILSTPSSVPLQPGSGMGSSADPQHASHSTFRLHTATSGLNTRSSVEISDRVPPSPQSASGSRNEMTRSSVRIGIENDIEPLHTGRRTNISHRSTLDLSNIPSSSSISHDASASLIPRPLTANNPARNRSTWANTDRERHFDMPHEGVANPRKNESDIFFTRSPEQQRQQTAKAHVASTTVILPSGDGLPNHFLQSSRKNQASRDMSIDERRQVSSDLRRNAPNVAPRGIPSISTPSSSSMSSSASAPSLVFVPQLHLNGISSHRPTLIPVPAGVSSHLLPSSVASAELLSNRRAYGNAQNGSSLFDTEAMSRTQPRLTQLQQPIKHESLEPRKTHLKIVRHKIDNGDDMKNLLVWN